MCSHRGGRNLAIPICVDIGLYNTLYYHTYRDNKRSDLKFIWFITAVLKAAANEDRERQRQQRLDEDRKK